MLEASLSAREDVVVVGSSGHARVVLDVIEREGRYRIRGLLDDFRPPGQERWGYPILGAIDSLPEVLASTAACAAFVAVGDNFARREIAARLRRAVPAIAFVTTIHPSAQVGRDVFVGSGAVVMAGVTVNPGARIGDFCILNTRASLDHDSVLDEYSSLGPGVVTGGNVHVGACSAIGLGACLIEATRVGAHTVVGAGAVVVRDLGGECVAYGNPARVIRRRVPGEPYLRPSEPRRSAMGQARPPDGRG